MQGAAAAAAAEMRAREVPPPVLGADILRIAPPGLPRCPGSDSSWQRAASRRRARPPASPAAARSGGEWGRGKEGAPRTGAPVTLGLDRPCPAPRSWNRSPLLPYPLDCLSAQPPPGTPAVPPPKHPYSFLRLGHIVQADFPSLAPLSEASFPPSPRAGLRFPILGSSLSTTGERIGPLGVESYNSRSKVIGLGAGISPLSVGRGPSALFLSRPWHECLLKPGGSRPLPAGHLSAHLGARTPLLPQPGRRTPH